MIVLMKRFHVLVCLHRRAAVWVYSYSRIYFGLHWHPAQSFFSSRATNSVSDLWYWTLFSKRQVAKCRRHRSQGRRSARTFLQGEFWSQIHHRCLMYTPAHLVAPCTPPHQEVIRSIGLNWTINLTSIIICRFS